MQTGTNEVYVGRYFGEHAYEITPDLVRDYLEAVDDEHPWYAGASPFGGPVAPAMLLHSDVYRYGGWYLPRIYGNLHAKQEWEFFYPAMVGDRVVTRSVIVDRYIKRGREYVVNEVTCFGADGRMLNRGRTHQSFLLDAGGASIVVDKDREKQPDRRFEAGGGEALDHLVGRQKVISLEMCRKFSGPQKNYHTDLQEARKLGFPDILVQGMMSLCFISEMMTQRFGEGWLCGGRMSVNLVNVLWQGESVTAHGAVRELLPEGVKRRAQLQVWCDKPDGAKVVIGAASTVVD